MSNLIRSIDGSIQILGNQKPPRSGSFEVTINEEVVFSKFESGGFPNESEVRSWVNK